MSSLIVEVCKVDKVEKHPAADKLAIATVKGWKTCIRYDPVHQRAEFNEGDLCVYFPPDSILPPKLANSPEKVCKNEKCQMFNKMSDAGQGICVICGEKLQWKDGTPGRLGVMNYCAELPKTPDGEKQPGGRVKASRLRGVESFGFIIHIDPYKGDDPNWVDGTDVKEHFGITKWEPPMECCDGDAERPHRLFHKYTDIEHFANFPDVIKEGEEVVITEKLHGCLREDSKVMLANGEERNISEIIPGQYVISFDQEKNEFVEKRVIDVVRQDKSKEWIKLHFDNGDFICCTDDHLILTSNRGWVSAGLLTENDEIKSFDKG